MTLVVSHRVISIQSDLKAMAEQLLREERGTLPISVVRPTIVMGAIKEPIPGWVVNMDGPTRNYYSTVQINVVQGCLLHCGFTFQATFDHANLGGWQNILQKKPFIATGL